MGSEAVRFREQSTRGSTELDQVIESTIPASAAIDSVPEHPALHASTTERMYDVQYGKRSIGYIGGICLLVNNCLGPGLVQMNTQMQLSGWLPTIGGIMLFGGLAFVSCWMLMYAQSRVLVKKNSSSGRVEFTGICEHYFHHRLFLFSVFFYILTMIVQCVSGIQQTTQLMDLMIVRLFGKSCALEIYPNFFTIPCSNEDNGFSVFAAGSGVLSAGFIASAIVALPFGFFPLEDSIIFQILSCAVMGICVVMLGVDLSSLGFHTDRLPAVGTSMSGLVGLMMFNFSLAFSLPSWNNERKLEVGVKRSVSSSIVIGSLTMVVIGVLGALAFPPLLGSDKNLIDFASSSDRPVTIAAVYIFSLANNITTVPVFSIMIRYTLLEHKLIRKAWIANLVAILLPWLLVIPFSTGSGFSLIIEFGGSIFIGITCFVAPPVLFICALKPEWFHKKQTEGDLENTDEGDKIEDTIYREPEGSEQFLKIENPKHVSAYTTGSCVVLATLITSLVYSWYTSF